MKNSRYILVIAVRVVLITLNCLALIWLFKLTGRPATILFLIILLIYQMISLILYHNRINRDLANFLVFLQENDASLAFSKQRIDKSFRGLTDELNKINQKLQDARTDRERQFHYLQAVVKQVDTGIIGFDQDGKVEIFNLAAQKLLGLNSLKQVRTLDELYPELAECLVPAFKGISTPVKISAGGSNHILAVKSGSLKFDDRVVHLVSFQDIKPELEAGELDAWRKLIRIQRHEIINSITPITTLTTAIARRLKQGGEVKNTEEITRDQILDVIKSIEVIEDRSRGLIDFVERFRNLTDMPVLRKKFFHLKNLFDHIGVLYSKEMNSRNISLKASVNPDDHMLNADEKLLEQVMINLVRNSLDAIQGPAGEISITGFKDPMNNTVIKVIDNGSGIDQKTMESIFIPAFTTKEKGSGIGLSLIRQIVHMHRGTLEVKSDPGIKTVFEIVLPN